MSPSVISTVDATNAPLIIPNGIEDAKSSSVTVNDINGVKSPSDVASGTDEANEPSVIPGVINGANGHARFPCSKSEPEGAYQILPQYHSKPSKIRVAGIGAGASGMYTQNLNILACR